MYNTKLHFHFTGIGGSGMSGLAEILINLGFRVSGSDLRINASCERLRRLGAEIFEGHRGENLAPTTSLLVYSSAVDQSNPEVQEAYARKLPVIRRAEVLAELMRLKFGVGVAGSHGKTTTTSMTAAILEHAAFDPTVVIGGQVTSMASGGKLGRSDYLVAETDESDRSFLLLKPTVAIITNIDAEHLSAYSSLKDLEDSFELFALSVPFYGLAILCIDDPRVRALAHRYDRRAVTYGFSPDARIRAENFTSTTAGVAYDLIVDGAPAGRISLPILGRHLAQNSLAAIAVGREFGIPMATIAEALASFSGVKRRLETIGTVNGATIISDYGHHPAEIRATLQAIRDGWGSALRKLTVVFQPHRYSRTRDCFAEFIDAFGECDELVMTEIYPASEPPIPGITGEKLAEAIARPKATFIPSLEDVPEFLQSTLAEGDVVVCLGAGPIGAFAEKLPERLLQRAPRALVCAL